MTVHEATLRALLLAPKILALCENDKERRKQIQIWENELKKYTHDNGTEILRKESPNGSR